MASEPSISVRNQGEPIRLVGVNLSGIAAHAARPGERLKVWTRLALTSDDPLFHRIAEQFDSTIACYTRQAGAAASLSSASTVLLVIRPDQSAELWIDAAAVSLNILAKRDIRAGSVVFERDIGDVVGMNFPRVKIDPTDRVVCLFRQDWRFALFFDLDRSKDLSLDALSRTLGTLYRNLRYRHLYDTVADEITFSRLVEAGWFPFVEILGSEFRELANCCQAEFDLADVETRLVEKFDDERLDRMLARWVAKPHFASKESLLKAAVNAFKQKEPIAVNKIVLTEIEGVLTSAHRAATGRGAKVKELIEFAISSAKQKAGASDTLLLPQAFGRYLNDHTFAHFDPAAGTGTAGSRHAVGHGAAATDSYTQVRALQALLTLDQFAFYT